ncbi:hypothetical protein PG993_009933 [Apiospora rasikravindrae]|uniref:F-box domain-containing protein n=1 Tax=Apiospora rasikravindrae TaxID=990691 RepID=A0ABR1SN46_9PEZI
MQIEGDTQQQQDQSAVDLKLKGPDVFPILDLPTEVRLQVYKWVHLKHPIRAECSVAYVCKRVVAVGEGASKDSGPLISKAERSLLSPHRPWAAIPTAFLQTCRQVHAEARALALEENELDFASLSPTKNSHWHAGLPGLWAARACTSRLLPQPWQRDALRYARLEVTAWDLVLPGGGAVAAWVGLCGLWAAGLRGLRLKIQSGGGGLFGRNWVVWEGAVGSGDGVGSQEDINNSGGGVGRGEMIPLHVVLAGLRLLKALRQLEIELALPSWDAERKLAWCGMLGEALNEDRGKGSRPMDVICVEQV